ncbi:MAG: extracellular solute-binding protein [Clostridia bacterium]|nr:extracellular solute-binding protein [Clostridia bacterium]
MKKHFSLFLCLSMLAVSLAGCGGEGTEQPATEEKTTVPAVTEEVIPLPEADYAGADVKILTAAEQWQYFYITEQTGDAIDDAVYERNRAVEERYNVNLDYQVYNGYGAGKEAVRAALTGSVMGGSAEFDLMVGGIAYITPYAVENLFADLYTFDTLNLDQPWWFSYINDELDLNGRLYLGSGYYGMLSMENAVVTYFNKQVAEDHGIEDLYTIVNNGTWTFDKMVELSKTVLSDLNGDGKYNANDRVGILTTNDYFSFFVNSMGYLYTSRNSDGSVVLNEPTEKLIDICDKLNEALKSDYLIDGYDSVEMLGAAASADESYEKMINLFAANQALFMSHRLAFSTRETMRNMEKYGIIPCPKYDKQQENYITALVNDVAAIPGVVADTAMSAVLLEAMQYYTYDIVRPQYYEIALKRKGTRDNESEKMLDMIFEHTFIDFSYMYINLIGSELYYGITQKNYASWAESNYKKFQTNIDKIIETVKGFES